MDEVCLCEKPALTLRELEAQITELAGHLNAANYRWLSLIAEFDRTSTDGRTVRRSRVHIGSIGNAELTSEPRARRCVWHMHWRNCHGFLRRCRAGS